MADAIFKHFGPGTIFEQARLSTEKPVKGPWTNHNIKIFLANREKGATPAADPSSADPDGLCKAVVVVGLLSGKAELLDTVEKCVKTTQVSRVFGRYSRKINPACVLCIKENFTLGERCGLDMPTTVTYYQ